jgi:hypothetical protein
VAAPEKKVKKPAGLKTRPAWLRQDWNRTKLKSRLECDTRKNRITNRVKNNLIQKCVLGWLSAQCWKLRKTTTKKYEQRVTVQKVDIVVAAYFQ